MQPGRDFIGIGTSLAIMREDNLLLYKRIKPLEAGTWTIVGGKLDFLEPGAKGAVREAEEETGLTIGKIEFLTTLERLHADAQQHWILMIYQTRDFAGDAIRTEPDKLSDFGWFALNDLPEPLSEVTRAILPLLR